MQQPIHQRNKSALRAFRAHKAHGFRVQVVATRARREGRLDCSVLRKRPVVSIFRELARPRRHVRPRRPLRPANRAHHDLTQARDASGVRAATEAAPMRASLVTHARARRVRAIRARTAVRLHAAAVTRDRAQNAHVPVTRTHVGIAAATADRLRHRTVLRGYESAYGREPRPRPYAGISGATRPLRPSWRRTARARPHTPSCTRAETTPCPGHPDASRHGAT